MWKPQVGHAIEFRETGFRSDQKGGSPDGLLEGVEANMTDSPVCAFGAGGETPPALNTANRRIRTRMSGGVGGEEP